MHVVHVVHVVHSSATPQFADGLQGKFRQASWGGSQEAEGERPRLHLPDISTLKAEI